MSQSDKSDFSPEILTNANVGGNVEIDSINIEQTVTYINHNLPEIYKPKGIPHNIPQSNTIQFVGRTESLLKIHEQLKEKGTLAITAVKGMGGVGKTELTIQYSLVSLFLETYQGGICWVTARSENVGLQIVNFAQTYLGVTPPDDYNLEQQVEFCWARWQEHKAGKVLIIFDDVTDYRKEITPYLPPQSESFRVLITSRFNFDLPSSISLEVLEEENAMELIRQWIGQKKVSEEIEEVKELCERLGYLPLGMRIK